MNYEKKARAKAIIKEIVDQVGFELRMILNKFPINEEDNVDLTLEKALELLKCVGDVIHPYKPSCLYALNIHRELHQDEPQFTENEKNCIEILDLLVNTIQNQYVAIGQNTFDIKYMLEYTIYRNDKNIVQFLTLLARTLISHINALRYSIKTLDYIGTLFN